MTYPTHDTQWALSKKGNWWRRKNGIALIVGEHKDGRFWARRGDDFMEGSYGTIAEAQRGAETNTSGENIQWDED
jgi:hypothetical protein